MIRNPRITRTLVPGLATIACVFLPEVAVAQTPPAASGARPRAEPSGHSIHSMSLGTTIREARQSPFHAFRGADPRVVSTLAGSGLAHPLPVPPETPAGDSLPSFNQVFLPTLLMA